MDIELSRNNASAHRLAHRIEADIRSRGLRPGDQYLTAEKAGRALGVSTATASRAMKLMAERDMLIRYRNRGTFVRSRSAAKHPGARSDGPYAVA